MIWLEMAVGFPQSMMTTNLFFHSSLFQMVLPCELYADVFFFLFATSSMSRKSKTDVMCLQWDSSPINDMYADAVMAVILRVQQEPEPKKKGRPSHMHRVKQILQVCCVYILLFTFVMFGRTDFYIIYY